MKRQQCYVSHEQVGLPDDNVIVAVPFLLNDIRDLGVEELILRFQKMLDQVDALNRSRNGDDREFGNFEDNKLALVWLKVDLIFNHVHEKGLWPRIHEDLATHTFNVTENV